MFLLIESGADLLYKCQEVGCVHLDAARFATMPAHIFALDGVPGTAITFNPSAAQAAVQRIIHQCKRRANIEHRDEGDSGSEGEGDAAAEAARARKAVIRFLHAYCNHFFVPVERPKAHVAQLYYRDETCQSLYEIQERNNSDAALLMRMLDVDHMLQKEFTEGPRTARDASFFDSWWRVAAPKRLCPRGPQAPRKLRFFKEPLNRTQPGRDQRVRNHAHAGGNRQGEPSCRGLPSWPVSLARSLCRS